MAKIVLSVNNKNAKKGDILVYNGEDGFNMQSYALYNNKLYAEVKALKEENKALKEELTELKKAVNEKLENYHNILQILVKK